LSASVRDASLRPVQGLAVVIPAHDEEQRLGRCIDSVHRALDHRLVRSLPHVVVVVLDACQDHSRAVAEARTRTGDVVVEVGVHNVGAARAAGSSIALHELARRDVAIGRSWLANTDADTTVPPWWLARQLRFAQRADAVAGVVRVDDWSEHAPGTEARFASLYGQVPSSLHQARAHDDAHPHVHGANLGVRGDAYRAAGGFASLSCSEDHMLWQSLRSDGRTLVSTRRVWVTTSGRRAGRAAGGFADTLHALDPTRGGARFPSPRCAADTTPSGTA
jgi:glycosyltransferase involved in cell wall biosynthesis